VDNSLDVCDKAHCLLFRLRVMADLCDTQSNICRALTQHRRTSLMLKSA